MSEEYTSDAAPATSTEATDASAENEELQAGEETEEQEQQEELPKKVIQDLKKKYNLKVNNKMKELELDLGNDAEVQKYLQKALAADEKFEEAANIKKGFAQLIEQIKTNPLAILSHPDIGVDIKALATQVLAQEMEDMEKSPEQKRIEELERKLMEREEHDKQAEEEKRSAEMSRMEHQAVEELDNQITQALDKSELPRSPYVVKRIADTMLNAIRMGYNDVTVDQIMPFVEEQVVSEIQALFDAAPEQTSRKLMEKFVGKKNLDRYRKSGISKPKPTTLNSVQDTGKSGSSEKKEEIEEVSVKSLLGF